MTDISKGALASAWEEFEICAKPNGDIGGVDLYDVDGMQDHAYTIHSIARAQAARIEELEAQLATARNDALKEAADEVRQECWTDGPMSETLIAEQETTSLAIRAILALITKETQ